MPDKNTAIESHLEKINQTLAKSNVHLKQLDEYLTYKSPVLGWVEFQVRINVATPNPPTIPPNVPNQNQDPQQISDNISIPGYLLIDIWTAKNQSNARKIWIVNDGGGLKNEPILVRQSMISQQFSQEFAMINGETRTLSDVRDLRIRSTDSGQTVRISEREILPPYASTITNPTVTPAPQFANQPDFIAQNIAVTFPGDSVLPNISIPDGFALLIVANENNLGQIYISRTDATIPTLRTTLGPGSIRALFITNANLVHLAANSPGNSVDIIVELSI